MTALKDRFWAKVLFKEFIRHYRKLTDEQIVADIEESMDALEELDDSGDSFGAKMVRWSMERAEEPSAVASRENGKKGGRPRKDANTPESTSTDDAHEGRGRSGADSLTPKRQLPMPSKEELYDFVRAEGLDEADARDWFEMTVVDRDGRDRDGRRIGNWKGACRKFCKSRKDGRAA